VNHRTDDGRAPKSHSWRTNDSVDIPHNGPSWSSPHWDSSQMETGPTLFSLAASLLISPGGERKAPWTERVSDNGPIVGGPWRKREQQLAEYC
jgi:hypothetical protein